MAEVKGSPLLWLSRILPLLFIGSMAPVLAQYRSPRITEHPKDVIVKKNEPTTLNCKGEGKPEPKIEWYKDGVLLNNDPKNAGRRIFLPGGDLFFLSVADTKKDSDSGLYWCVARNQVGTVKSRNATLQVGVIRDDFRAIPEDTRVVLGETVTLICRPPRGSPEPQILWRKDGQSLDTRMGSTRVQTRDGGNLVIKDVKSSDTGRYQCLAINIAGTRSTPEVLLTVLRKPFFTKEPKDTTVLVGESATFICEVGGTPEPDVNWYRQDIGMPGGGRAERIRGGLRIRDARADDEGLYFCQANNDLGSIRASAILSVHSLPKFIVRPRDVAVGLKEQVRLECSASGNPTPKVYWRKEGNRKLMLKGSSHGHLHVGEEGTLYIQGARREDFGLYVCTALSPAGSRDAVVRVEMSRTGMIAPPIITMGPSNQTLPVKSNAQFPCEVGNGHPAEVKWLRDAHELVSENERIYISGNGTLLINDLRGTDSGEYTCVVSSSSGETSASGYLSVESPTNPNIAFHKTNPTLLPAPPSRPNLLNKSNTSITLSWTWSTDKPGFLPARGQPVLGFTIEAYSPHFLHNGWVILGSKLKNKKNDVYVHHIDQLTPGTPYIFIVRAENMEGLSPPSEPSDPITTSMEIETEPNDTVDQEGIRSHLATSEIDLMSVVAASSSSIRLTWKVSKAALHFIDGFLVRYHQVAEYGAHEFKVLTVIAQKDDYGAYSHVIPNLSKFTRYEVFVSPFYKTVEGQPSNTVIVTTAEDRPSAAPEHLVAKMLNRTSAELAWSLPPAHHQNGILSGYRVELQDADVEKGLSGLEQQDYKFHTILEYPSNVTSVVLHNLTLGRTYYIRLCARTSVGYGPWSSRPLELTMDPELLASLERKAEKEVAGGSEHDANEDGGATNLWKKLWFLLPSGSLVVILAIVVIVLTYKRRRVHGKKDHISGVVVAPHTDAQFMNGKQNLWIDHRWRQNDFNGDKDCVGSDTKLLANPNHFPIMNDLSDGGIGGGSGGGDYAEVDPQTLTTFWDSSNSNSHKGLLPASHHQNDLTPYATTTLIQQRRPPYELNPNGGGGTFMRSTLGPECSDHFGSGRSKFSLASHTLRKFTSPSHASTTSAPSAFKMSGMASQPNFHASPAAINRSHLTSIDYPSSYHPAGHLTSTNENLYHIGEIVRPMSKGSGGSAGGLGSSNGPYGASGPGIVPTGVSNYRGMMGVGGVMEPGEEVGGGVMYRTQQGLMYPLPQPGMVMGGASHMANASCSGNPLVDREIQSSLPSLASDVMYAEADENAYGVPGVSGVCSYFNASSGSSSVGGFGNPVGHSGGSSGIHCVSEPPPHSSSSSSRLNNRNSRSTSPAYSSDSFNSGKSLTKRLYNNSSSSNSSNNASSSSGTATNNASTSTARGTGAVGGTSTNARKNLIIDPHNTNTNVNSSNSSSSSSKSLDRRRLGNFFSNK